MPASRLSRAALLVSIATVAAGLVLAPGVVAKKGGGGAAAVGEAAEGAAAAP